MTLAGYIDVATRESVQGWALEFAPPGRPADVAISINGRDIFRGVPESPRPDLARVYGSANHGFKLTLDPPLLEGEFYEVLLYATGSGEILAKRVIPRLKAPCSGDGQLQPVFVSFSGRSGSTVAMKMLESCREVVVAGSYPYEVMLSGYYAQAHSVLTNPGDHAKSSNPSNAWESPFWTGGNPFYHHQFSKIIGDPSALYDALGRQVNNRLGVVFRDAVLGIYQKIAGATGSSEAVYFAEKCTLHSHVRDSIDSIFPNRKEILLIRDLRDIYCSSKAFWSVGSEFFEQIKYTNDLYLKIRREAGPGTLIVRYEDLVLKRERTARMIAAFLNLSRVPLLDSGSEQELFTKHGTSSDPQSSIGRWKKDLTPDEQQKFADSFGDFFRTFDYEV